MLVSKFAHPRRVRMSRTKTNEENERARKGERETDRGRDVTKDIAKRRKGDRG